MDRQEFLAKLGASAAFVVFTGCLGSCKNEKKKDPTPNPGTGTGGKVDFSVNLDDAAFSALKTNGNFKYRNNIIIARANDGAFLAVSEACTHQGTSVRYDASGNRFTCPNHGSVFSSTGTVVNGPAALPLKQYKTALTGSMLRIFD